MRAPATSTARAPAPLPPPPPTRAPPPSQGGEESSGNSSGWWREHKERKKEKKREKKRRRESHGNSQASTGGGQGGGKWGGGGRRRGGWGVGGGGGGHGGGQLPPTPPKLTLPQWLLKALGPTSAAARKAALVPWSAQALQEGCGRYQPLFAGVSHAHMTLEWVFRRLVCCQIRRARRKQRHVPAG